MSVGLSREVSAPAVPWGAAEAYDPVP